MKKITLLLCFLTVSLGYSQVVLEDFSSVTLNASGGANGDYGSFGGVTASLTIDMSDNVGQAINDTAGEPWQGIYLTVDTNYMDLTTNKTVTVDVYNNDASSVYLLGQVEEGQAGAANSQALATHNGMGWQTLSFDFSSPANSNPVANGEYGQFTLYTSVNSAGGFVGDASDPGNNAVDVTILIDDITAVAGASVTPPASVDFPLDFESLSSSDVSGFDGCTATVEAVMAPQTTGNSSTKLMKMVRNGGQIWAGASIDVDSAMDLSTNRYITMEVWTNASTGTIFNIKTENPGVSSSGDITGVTTQSQNAWHTLSWDLNAHASLTNQTRFAMLPNQGVTGDGSIEFFVDNIQNVSTLSNDDFSLENKISVFPNPSNNGVWNILASVSITNISLYDILGKNVMSVNPNASSVKLDATGLPAGLYFARLTSETGTKSVKLVKQ